ncbi:MAG: hypothetical protein AAFO96_03515 [Bacteroidota bacterium]
MSQSTKTRNILITDYDGGGNVMIFTKTITAEHVKLRLDKNGKTYTDIVEILDEHFQYYVYEQTWVV